jgi:hypothetical protein
MLRSIYKLGFVSAAGRKLRSRSTGLLTLFFAAATFSAFSFSSSAMVISLVSEVSVCIFGVGVEVQQFEVQVLEAKWCKPAR